VLVLWFRFFEVGQGERMNHPFRFLALVSFAVVLSACGGGGSVDDGTVDLTVTPSEIELSSPRCGGSGAGPKLMVYGGVEPYVIHNPIPSRVQLSTTFLRNAGGTIDVFIVGGGCLDAIPFTVTDADANTVTFTISHVDSSN
jgi:hypothetical protein